MASTAGNLDQQLIDPAATHVFDSLLSKRFIQILADNPALNWLPVGQAAAFDRTYKFIWQDEVRTETVGTLDANIALAATSITLTDTSMFTVGDTLWIDGQNAANGVQVVYRVTVVFSGTVLTVVRLTTEDIAVTAAAQSIHITGGIADNEKPGSTDTFGAFQEYTNRDNIMQIFQETGELGDMQSTLAKSGLMYGVTSGSDLMLQVLDQALYRMQYKMYQAFVNGFRFEPTNNTDVPLMDGVISFVNTAGNLLRRDAAGATVTEDMINDVFQNMFDAGTPLGAGVILVLSPGNARVISALKDAKITYDTSGIVPGGQLGQSVQQYNGEIFGTGAKLVVDSNMPTDRILVLTPQNIEMVPAAGFPTTVVSQDATVPGQFGRRTVLRSMWSLVVKGQNHLHSAIYNLI